MAAFMSVSPRFRIFDSTGMPGDSATVQAADCKSLRQRRKLLEWARPVAPGAETFARTRLLAGCNHPVDGLVALLGCERLGCTAERTRRDRRPADEDRARAGLRRVADFRSRHASRPSQQPLR